MKLTEIAINRPTLIIVIFAVLTFAGLISYPQLGYELIPEFSQPTITVTTLYPGASPSEVERSVSRKMEDALSELDGITDITSKSLESASLVIVNFKYGADIDLRIQDAQRKIDQIISELPSDAESPILSKVSPSDLPVMQLIAYSDLPGGAFYKKMEDDILPRLQQIKGVAEIQLLGGEEREIQVSVDREKLELYRLSLLQVTEAVNRANVEFPTGKVRSREDQLTVRLAGRFESVEELRGLVIATTPAGGKVRLSDVAEVSDGIGEVSSVSRYNGRNGIGLLVKKQPDANAVELSENVRRALEEAEHAEAAAGLRFAIASDSAEVTLEAADSVMHDLLLAILLVGAVMLFFLKSIRNAIIVMVAIPTSLVATLAIMYMLGYSLNLMTLLGMSLVIGILVDDSIVVIENIYRHLEMGKTPYQAAIEGVQEISLSAISITLVIVVVFLPIAFVNTIVADILRQFSVTVAAATLFSLFVCFTLTPWLASRFSRLEHLNEKNPLNWLLIGFERLLKWTESMYERGLRWSLRYKLGLFAIIAVLFAGMVWVGGLGISGQEFVAEGDKGEFMIKLEYDKQTTVEENNLRSRQIEAFLAEKPEVVSIFSNVGGPSIGFNSTGQGASNRTELTVQLVSAKERAQNTEEYMIEVRRQIQDQFPAVEVGCSKIGLVSNTQAPIEIVLNGNQLAPMLATAGELANLIRATPGANDVEVSVEAGNPEVLIDIDREKMARQGLNVGIVGATLQNAFTGNDDSSFRDQGEDYDIRIQLDHFDRNNPDDVRNITFVNPKGEIVKLDQFASIDRGIGAAVLERKDRRTAVTVTSWTLGKPSGTLAQDIQARMAAADFQLPPGVEMKWAGDIERQEESFGAMGLALLTSILLVYLIMVALYDSFVYPFVVLVSIPVAIIGAVLALALSMSSFSIFTMLGFIMLVGLVAKNAILIVDFANQLKARGESSYDAVVLAGRERLRPILMTTIAMVIGMLPIALAGGVGAEWKNGMAWALIGGLTSSLLLTVFLAPVVFHLVDQIGAWFGRVFRSRKPTAAELARS